MKLSTTVNIPEIDVKLNHREQITLMGSCFAESIGEKLSYHKFDVCKNPFGIIYNPISISKALVRIIENKPYTTDDLVQFNDNWLSFDHHGCFSNREKEACLNDINASLNQAHKSLKTTQTVIITFGSAWVYEKEGFGAVANCHKVPAKEFTKRLLSVKEIIADIEKVIERLKDFHPKLKIIFTVSPVRHIKDGLKENNLSKSSLHLAVHHLVTQHQNCHYFPAYELVIDELRDYRFYKDDLVHPTELAVTYVWEKFGSTFFNAETSALNKEVAKIQRALAHKPFQSKSKEYQKFEQQTQDNIKQIKELHPYLHI